MRKTLLYILIMSILSVCGLFSACGVNYDDIKIELEQSSIVIYLSDDDEEVSEEININTAKLSATISVPNDKMSQEAIFDIENKSIARIINVEFKDGVSSATFLALTPGETKINVHSVEGNKKVSVNLKVVLRAESIEFKPDFSLAVALGETKVLSSDFLNFSPVNTNQTSVNFSLGDSVYNGITLQDNILSVTQNAYTGTIKLFATNAENEELVASTNILIYRPISVSDVSIRDLDTDSDYNSSSTIVIARNSENNNKSIKVNLPSTPYDFKLNMVSSDRSSLAILSNLNDNTIFTLVGVETGEFIANLSIGIDGYTNQTQLIIPLKVKVIDVATQVLINGSSKNASMNIYDYYTAQAESLLGSKISFSVVPSVSTYKVVKFEIAEEDLTKLQYLRFTNSRGELIEDINGYECPSDSFIRVKALQAMDLSLDLIVKANSSFENGKYEVSNYIKINIKKGVESISFGDADTYIDYLQYANQWQELDYIINETPASELTNLDFSQLTVRSQKTNILETKMENGRLYIRPISVGDCKIYMQSTTGVSANINLKVVVPGHSASVELNRNAYKDVIAQMSYDNSLLTEIKANVGAIFTLELNKSPINLSVWNLSFTSSNRLVATISDMGLVRANSSGDTQITISGTFVEKNESGVMEEREFSQTIALQVFRPITTFSIGKDSATLYDVNTIGYLDAEQYSVVNFSVIMSDSYISKSAVEFKLSRETSVEVKVKEGKFIEYIGENGILFDYLDGTAKFIAKLSKNLKEATAYVTATVKEFDREYSSTCTISISKAETISSIYLVDYDEHRGVYFKKSDIGIADNYYQIQSTIYPFDAVNTQLYYVAFDYDDNGNVVWDKKSQVVSVSSDGKITPLKEGKAIVRVFPKSSLIYDNDSDGVLSDVEILSSAEHATLCKDIQVSIADGSLDNPYRIYTVTDFLNIANDLNSHYVLANNIDFRNVTLNNTIGGVSNPFTGSLSGEMKVGDNVLKSKLLNITLLESCNPDDNTAYYYGLFGAIEGTYISYYDEEEGKQIEKWECASIHDLEIEFINISLTLKNFTNSQTIYFGALAGELKGKIENVDVIINNLSITSSDEGTQSYENLIIGGLVGQIKNITFEDKEKLSIIEKCSIESIESFNLNLSQNDITFGGIAGINNGQISGNNEFLSGIDDSNNDTNDVYAFALFDAQTFDVNISVLATFNNAQTNNSIFGGVAGVNNGIVQNIATQGKIQAKDVNNNDLCGKYLGGIVGLNSGTIFDVMSDMFVYGDQNVGGIAGANGTSGKIELACYEVFDSNSTEPVLKGNQNIGGVVGANAGTIKYTYFESFRNENSYFAIVSDKNNSYVDIGGVVGESTAGTISISWSNASIKGAGGNIGGFIGMATSTKIENCYTKATIFNPSNTNDTSNSVIFIGGFMGHSVTGNTVTNTYSACNEVKSDNSVGILEKYLGNGALSSSNSYYLIDDDSNNNSVSGGANPRKSSVFTSFDPVIDINWFTNGNWAIDAGINDGFPYLIYASDGKSYDFISEAPESIEVIVQDSVENKHYKVDKHKAIVFLNNVNGTVDRINLTDIIQVKTTPIISKKVLLDVEILSGQDNISLQNGTIKPLKKGLVLLKIFSRLNNDASDILQLYIMPGASKMNIVSGLDADYQGDKINYSLKMRKDASKIVEFSFENILNGAVAQVNNQIGIQWENLREKVDGEDETIDYGVVNGTLDETSDTPKYFVDYGSTNIITAKTSVSAREITVSGFVEAEFLSDENSNITVTGKYSLPWLSQTFDFTVFEGVSRLELSQTNQSITPNDSALITATIFTDVKEDYVSKINVYDNGALVQEITIEKTDSGYTISEPGDNDLFNFEFVGMSDKLDFNSTLQFTFLIAPTSNLYNIDASKNYAIEFVVENSVDSSLIFTKILDLMINPQPVLRISMLHFADFKNGDVASDEMATNLISCGVEGLIKLNMYPYFADADYIELTSSTPNGYVLSFLQQAFDQRNEVLINKRQGSTLIENGIRLDLLTGYNKDDNKPYFDGDLWVKTLLNSDAQENTEFIITAVAYKDGQAIFSQSMSLYSDFVPRIGVSYPEGNCGQIAKGTDVEFEVFVDTIGGTLFLDYTVYDEKGNELDLDSTFNMYDYDENNNLVVIGTFDVMDTISAKIGSQARIDLRGRIRETKVGLLSVDIVVPAGFKIEVTATLTTTINNIFYTRSSKFEVYVSDFIVNNVYIENAEYGTLDMAINRTTNLSAKVKTTKYSSHYDSTSNKCIAKSIKDIDASIERLEKEITRTQKVWFIRYSTNPIIDQNFGVSDSLVNYSYKRMDDGVIVLFGKKISTDSLVVLKVGISYGNVFIDGAYLHTAYVDINSDYEPEFVCNLNITDNSTEDNPTPIYTQEEFMNMTSGVHYIMMENITLTNWVPMLAEFSSLDGNGKIIRLESFDFSEIKNSSENYVGLFTNVSENTMLKNLIVDIRLLLNSQTTATLNLTNLNDVKFGILAGQNEGIINNCEIMNIESFDDANNENNFSLVINTSATYNSTLANHSLGGLVGYNKGYISNSRVGRKASAEYIGDYEYQKSKQETTDSFKPIDFKITTNFGALVGQNFGVVASSYVQNVSIMNVANSGFNIGTAGFITTNYGRISSSYAVGYVGYIDGNLQQNIFSYGNISGFVLHNSGSIDDCYSYFIMQTPASSAGFILDNSGTIKNCYTYSRFLYIDDDGQTGDTTTKNNSSFRAFTGVDDFNQVQNSGKIEYSYYIKLDGDYVFIDEPAIAITEDSKFDKTKYVGFAFSEITNAEGVWSIQVEELPKLVSADKIGTSIRKLMDIDELKGSDIYIYAEDDDFKKGSENNPYLIYSTEQFNDAFKVGNLVDSKSYKCETNIRVVKDLDFTSTGATMSGLNSSMAIYSNAVFDGNGMILSGITITGDYVSDLAQDSSTKLSQKQEFGLFARLDNAIVKNLNLSFVTVDATDYSIVGALAGVAVDSLILSTNIDSKDVVVQGKNVVGGMVGMLLGESQMQNITSNISVSATYRNDSSDLSYTLSLEATNQSITSEKTRQLKDIYSLRKDDSIKYYNELLAENALPNTSVSYAGGIIGAAVVGDENMEYQQCNTMKVYGDLSISAERSGGVVGYNSQYSRIYDVMFELSYGTNATYKQFIAGIYCAGGIVGENHGSLDKSRLDYAEEHRDTVNAVEMGKIMGASNLFTASSEYQGTIIGMNIDGTINDSYSRANLYNTEANYVGLVAGYTLGGVYTNIYVTGDLLGKVAGGGFSGFMDVVGDTAELISEFKNVIITANYSFATYHKIVTDNFKLGALAGYANGEMSNIFKELLIESFDNNVATTHIYKNVQYKDYIKIDYVASINVSTAESEEQEQEFLDQANEFVAQFMNEEKPTEEVISFVCLVDNYLDTFQYLDSDNWTKADLRFPLLNISHKQLEIVINANNKSQLITLLRNNPNAYFIIEVDIDLNNDVDMKDFESSIGDAARPFTGAIIGKAIAGRAPLITLRGDRVLFGDLQGANIVGIKFATPSTNTGTYNISLVTGKEYYSPIAIKASNCSFKNIEIELDLIVSAEAQSNNGVIGGLVGEAERCVFNNIKVIGQYSVAKNTSYGDLTFGALVGQSNNSKFDAIHFDGKFIAEGFSANSLNMGMLIGEAINSQLVNCKIRINATDENSGMVINVNDTNIANIGGIVGYGQNISIRSSMAYNEIYNDNIIMITFKVVATSCAELNVGGILGQSLKASLSSCTVEWPIFVKGLSQINSSANVGGLIGYGENSSINITSSKVISNLKSEMSGATSGNSEVSGNGKNLLSLGGLVGNLEIESKSTLSKNYYCGDMDISVDASYNSYIGGLIGYSNSSVIDRSNYSIASCYGQCNIYSKGTPNEIYIGGIIGYSEKKFKMENIYYVGRINILNSAGEITAGGLVGSLGNAVVNSVYSDVYYTIKSDISFVKAKGLFGGLNSSATINNAYYVRENVPEEEVYYDGESYIPYGTSLNSLLGYSDAEALTGFSSNNWICQEGYLPILSGLDNPLGYNEDGSIYKPVAITSGNAGTVFNTEMYKHYILTEDLILNKKVLNSQSEDGTIEIYAKDRILSGVLNGGGHLIILKNLPYLFSEITDNATLANLNVKVIIDENAEGYIIIDENARTDGNELYSEYCVGALAGKNYGFINYVSASGKFVVRIIALEYEGDEEVKVEEFIGGLVGLNEGYIGYSQSFVNINITNESSTNICAGGLVGKLGNTDEFNDYYANIINSFNSGDISLPQDANSSCFLGGIAGKVKGRALLDTIYVNGLISPLNGLSTTGYGRIYGAIGVDSIIECTKVYNDMYSTLISQDNSAGTIDIDIDINDVSFKDLAGNSDFDSAIWSSYKSDSYNYTSDSKNGVINYGYPYLKYNSALNLTTNNYMKTGTGTSNDPIKIKSQSNLYLIDDICAFNTKGKNYILEKDISCIQSGVMIRTFYGTFDGNNHCISHLNITSADNGHIGFIGFNFGTIKNITFKDITIEIPTGSELTAVGALVAENIGGKISDITLSNIKINMGDNSHDSTAGDKSNYIGGVIGCTSGGSISDIKATDISINLENTNPTAPNGTYLGGFIGYSKTQLEKIQLINVMIGESSNRIKTSAGYKYIGGFIGYNLSTIKQSLVKGNSEMYILSNSSDGRIGGFAGESGGRIFDCYTMMNMDIYGDVGEDGLYAGFAGKTTAGIDYCYSKNSINIAGDFQSSYYHSFVAAIPGGDPVSYCLSSKSIDSTGSGITEFNGLTTDKFDDSGTRAYTIGDKKNIWEVIQEAGEYIPKLLCEKEETSSDSP